MIRSLLSGLSGIKVNQLSLDVVGNNIANINTPSFKAGRASFSDVLSQMLRSGTAPTGTQGGLDPMQIGRGATVGAIGTTFSQGSMETTSNPTDLAIAGDGFFVLRHGEEQFFTRDGSFDVDASGTLVDPGTGYAVQGRMANTSGQILSSTLITNIVLPIESLFPARATTSVSLTGNLDATAATGAYAETYQTSVLVYDSLGDTHTITITFERLDPTTAANSWNWTAAVSGSDTITQVPASAPGILTFNADGSIATGGSATITIDDGSGGALQNGADAITIGLGLSGLVQYAGAFTPVPSDRDGRSSGALDSISFDAAGTLVGTFTNGATQTLAQVVLADFHNPPGLNKSGANLYTESMNSGAPLIGIAGSSIRATIVPGALEGSNVDLASEFTKMIIAQRGFEANSKVVMISDAILGALINLKR